MLFLVFCFIIDILHVTPFQNCWWLEVDMMVRYCCLSGDGFADIINGTAESTPLETESNSESSDSTSTETQSNKISSKPQSTSSELSTISSDLHKLSPEENVNGKSSELNGKSSEPIDTTGDRDQSRQTVSFEKMCGYGLAFLGVIGLSSGLACTQALDKSIPHSELNSLRFCAQFIITSPLLLIFRKCDVRVERPLIHWLIFGAFVLTGSSYMGYGSAYYLPLGVASGMTRSLSLIMNYTISCIINKSVRWYELSAAVICLTGVVMVTQPPLLFHGSNSLIISNMNGTYYSPCRMTAESLQSEHTSSNKSLHFVYTSKISPSKINVNNIIKSTFRDDSYEEHIGYIMCIIDACLCTTYIQLVSRKLANLNIFVYNFWISLFGAGVSFSIMCVSEIPVFPTVRVCILFLAVHMVSAGTHNILLYRAYQLIDPLVAALILTLQIASTFILQYTVLSDIHPGRANAFEISGAVIIFLGNALVPTYHVILAICLKQKTVI